MKNRWLLREHQTASTPASREVLFTVGNGYVGVRGIPEEGGSAYHSTLVHGLFNFAEGDLSPDLAPVPEWTGVSLKVDGVTFHPDVGRVLGSDLTLDLYRAVLSRRVLWQASSGAILRLNFERFASLANPHLLIQRVQLHALYGSAEVVVRSGLNGQRTHQGRYDHWTPWQSGSDRRDQVWLRGETNESHYRLGMCAALLTDTGAAPRFVDETQSPTLEYTLSLEPHQNVVMTKLVALHTSRDSADPVAAAQTTLAEARQQGYEALFQAHESVWRDVWNACDVIIEGDDFAQLAARFCLYHILIAAPRHDGHSSIGAKTLSGPGYRGHVFWDTDLFMIPPLTLMQPELSRNHMLYRYHTLPGARQKAAQNGYRGAMFPWESADKGEEVTPKWTLPNAQGERIRIWTGEREQHVTADIAYAAMQYWRWTGDDDFMRRYGAEIILDGAKFWASRAEWNEAKERYEITHVIGPDEYHEDVNNSVFTNWMARWHLQTGFEVWDWLRAADPAAAADLRLRLELSDQEFDRWRDVFSRLYIPFDAERQVHVQFDGFFNLPLFNVLEFEPRVISLQSVFGYEATQHMGIIKQADVVMLMALFGRELAAPEILLNNWNTYYPLCDHGSSLSPAVHAWVAARLGFDDAAYDLFMHAAGIDLLDNKGNSQEGIHGAACGGVWQAIAFGFAGLHLTDRGPALDPRLPAPWRRLRFSVFYHGDLYDAEIQQGGEARIEKRQSVTELPLPYSKSAK